MKKIQVAILGRNYASLIGMIRAVGELNCEITVIKSVHQIPKKYNIKNILKKIIMGKPIESTSKYVNKFLYTIEPDKEYLINLLLKTFEKSDTKVILIPTDDFTASAIDLHQKELKDKFLLPNIHNKTGEIVRLMDKNKQKEIAIKSGLNVAKSHIVTIENNNYTIPKGIVYPVFTKPQISFKGNKTLMKKCDSEADLKKVLDMSLKKFKCPILIEEYINIEKEYGVLGCSFDNEVIIPGIIEKLATGNGEHKGVTLLGKVTKLDSNNTLHQQLKKFIESIKFNGLFDFDLYESNGKIYFNELNLRFGAGGYGITKSGVNLPKIYISKLMNINNNDNQKIETKIFISDKVNLEDYEAEYISWKEYKEIYKKVDFRFIKSETDKGPYYNFKRKEIVICLKKIGKKMIKRKK